jgi:hypothetical protein
MAITIGTTMADSHDGKRKEDHKAQVSEFGHDVALMKGGENDELMGMCTVYVVCRGASGWCGLVGFRAWCRRDLFIAFARNTRWTDGGGLTPA